MNEQLSLLDYPNHPGAKRLGTSSDAAHAIAPRSKTLRDKCLALIREYPRTADECADKLNESVLAIRPRVTELFKLGHIAESGLRRKNASGASAIVWRAV